MNDCECKFCESYQSWKNIHKDSNRRYPKDEKMRHEYSVALLIHSWDPKYSSKRHAGRTTDYRNKGMGYKLNYCPECGRKLKVRG